MARNAARKASQAAQIAAIDQALMSFKSDTTYYPESSVDDSGNPAYCGAQKLAEALLGWDLLGFHPDTAWTVDGLDAGGGVVYDACDLDLRMNHYLNLSTANAFRLDQLFNNLGSMLPAAGDTHVICDSFGVRKITLSGAGKTRVLKAGTPILYYKANTTKKAIKDIYNKDDNMGLAKLGPLTPSGAASTRYHKFDESAAPLDSFYDYITDLTVLNSTGVSWPYNANSYILISAGVDGIYGTEDDITNF